MKSPTISSAGLELAGELNALQRRFTQIAARVAAMPSSHKQGCTRRVEALKKRMKHIQLLMEMEKPPRLDFVTTAISDLRHRLEITFRDYCG